CMVSGGEAGVEPAGQPRSLGAACSEYAAPGVRQPTGPVRLRSSSRSFAQGARLLETPSMVSGGEAGVEPAGQPRSLGAACSEYAAPGLRQPTGPARFRSASRSFAQGAPISWALSLA